ncbi:phytoene/squalene synthase family protein [Aurantiacibacter aquimixticola]|uniref:Phytoene/squalene synthase family protein n=1 Tax=Aurantiacibacter aquimixticola TaxID=1958945 RepID=A0A419RX85_9SPHN|nr:phytoene/squalene synthase family protein [Aurantiacibacter aquimixticola]RJY10384.1 phytoene/squalene synthase family protein [Aurantiacibacter aquimixticola]
MGGGRERSALVRKAHKSIAKGSKSFTVASWLFDKDTRDRSHLLYAWCRRCDDIADGQDHGGELNLEKSSPVDRVEAIRILTHRALDGQPTADVAFDALGQVASETGLTREMCDDVIDGFQLDAEGWRPRTEGDLMRYCYHVAGAVGVMMAKVMGVPADASDTLDRACDLGLAFQLNNIARDIAEDDAAGRCYLPEEWLAEMDIPPGQHMRPQYRGELVKLTKRLIRLAEAHDAAARMGAMHLTFRQRWAVLSAANIYGAIGEEVERQAEIAWDSRVHTGFFEKIGHVIAALKEAISGSFEPHEMPDWTRGKLMVMARMAQPAADIPRTPIRDEGVRPASE